MYTRCLCIGAQLPKFPDRYASLDRYGEHIVVLKPLWPQHPSVLVALRVVITAIPVAFNLPRHVLCLDLESGQVTKPRLVSMMQSRLAEHLHVGVCFIFECLESVP